MVCKGSIMMQWESLSVGYHFGAFVGWWIVFCKWGIIWPLRACVLNLVLMARSTVMYCYFRWDDFDEQLKTEHCMDFTGICSMILVMGYSMVFMNIGWFSCVFGGDAVYTILTSLPMSLIWSWLWDAGSGKMSAINKQSTQKNVLISN